MVSCKDIFDSAVRKLEGAGIDNAAFDAAELFELAFLEKYSLCDKTTPADTTAAGAFDEYIEKRMSGYPLQYILGEWEFYGIPIKVGDGVLIPRQDTETLIEVAKKKCRNERPVVIDLCSGSGCIALALERELDAKKVYAVEKSDAAVRYLEQNIALNGSKAEVIKGDCVDREIVMSLPLADVISCNPPYLDDNDMSMLQKEVTFEPAEALYGGEDGLDFYRDIARAYKYRLNNNGMIIFEVGHTQAEEVMEILIQAGFEDVRRHEDLCGKLRVVVGFYREKTHVKLY
ncbi:MAG: peptide chain release factor N(5)-glutamine methyltransferase [Ruminococcus sp.]|nr:peptide chain release factor N(5)-glutamine methyltransferase [Ruminococcus sp.]MBR1752461.1 peptide chain release factor N(5)-glutamine methyltransferase [Ruminococcus sp.]